MTRELILHENNSLIFRVIFDQSWKSAPCIMCVQYRWETQYCGGVQYHGGYHEYCGGISWVPWGYRGYHDKCGGYLEYCGGVQYRGGYHEYCGGYLEYHGMFSTVGDIMMHVEDIMSTVGGVQYCGGYYPLKFEYHGEYYLTCEGILWVLWCTFRIFWEGDDNSCPLGWRNNYGEMENFGRVGDKSMSKMYKKS